jgi:hypothetical protein
VGTPLAGLNLHIGPKGVAKITFATPPAAIEQQPVLGPKCACLAKVKSLEVLDLT